MAKATARNLDFTNVKEGGVFNTKRIEAGDYLAKIMKVEDAEIKTGDNKGTPQYLFTVKLVDHPSSVLPYRCALMESQLWKLRNILIAAGKAVPKRKSKVDPNTIIGKLIGVSIEDDEYEKNGETKPTSQIAGVFPAADLGEHVSTSPVDDDEDEDDEDSPLEEEETEEEEAEDEVEEEEEAEEDPLAELNRAQLKAAIIKVQSDFQARKSQSDDDLRDILRKLGDADEEEDDEPTPPPAKKKAAAAKKAPAKKKAKPKASDIEDDELDEIDIDSL